MSIVNQAFASTSRIECSIPVFVDNGTSTKRHLGSRLARDTWSFISRLLLPKSSHIAEPELTTSGLQEIATIPKLAIKSNKAVCSAAADEVSRLSASPQKRLAMSLLAGIQSHIFAKSEYREYTTFRPISYTYMSDDKTVVLEWAYRHGRITYFIDEDINESIALFIDDMNSTGHPVIKEHDLRIGSLSQLIAESVAFVARFAS